MRAQATRPGGRHCLNERGGLETGEQASDSTTVDQPPMPFHPAVCSIAELLTEQARLTLYAFREQLPRAQGALR